MNSACERYRDRLAAALTGDLDPRSTEELNRHCAECPVCADEQNLYVQALRKMRAAADVEVPRHFFQYPEEQQTPWQMFRRMHAAWQGGLGIALLALIVLAGSAVAKVQIRAENGGWLVSFGAARAEPVQKTDTSAFTNEILQIVEQRNREQALEWVRTLRAEMAQSNRKLTDRQRSLLADALARVEKRVDGHIAGVYQTVSMERERDNLLLRSRIDRIAVNGEIKNNQTDAILETLLQVAELNVK